MLRNLSLWNSYLFHQPISAMSHYELTDQLKKLINESNLDTDSKSRLLEEPVISHKNLITFYKSCRPTPTLLELLGQTKLHINKHEEKSKPKSPEFLRSMEMLRLQAKEEEYQRLVNPSPQVNTLYEQKFDDRELTPAQAHKELKSQLTTIVNILISVASVVYAVWYWADSSWKLQDSYRILLCLFFGILVLVAEVVVYMGYLNKIEEAKIKERKKKEVKKVITSIRL